ncbi:MAG: HlyD family secretion protein [Chthoniobacterales bacterium]
MNTTAELAPETEFDLTEDLDQPGLPPEKIPFLKRRPVVFAIAIVAIVVIVYVATVIAHSLSHETTDDAFINAHIVSISPKIAGKVLAVHVRDNEFVKHGQPLLEIDPRDAEAVLAAKQAALEVARAKKKNAEMAVEQSKAHVVTLQAGYAAAEANADAAAADTLKQRSDLKRNKELIAGGAISKQDFEHSTIDTTAAEATLDSKKKQLEAARAYAEEAKKSEGSAVAQADASDAEVKEAEAALRQQELQLSYTKLTAPEDGRVTMKAVEPGDYVQIGQALMAIVPREIWVTANFKETQLTQMRPGQSVEIEVDASAVGKLHGHLDSIQAGSGARFSLLPPENATGNFVKVVQRVPVKIVFDEQPDVQQVLGPGMSAVPDVAVGSSAVAVLVLIGTTVIAVLAVIVAAVWWLRRAEQI